jgi:hypothetical protein
LVLARADNNEVQKLAFLALRRVVKEDLTSAPSV